MPVGNSSGGRGRVVGGVLAFNLPELMLNTIGYAGHSNCIISNCVISNCDLKTRQSRLFI